MCPRPAVLVACGLALAGGAGCDSVGPGADAAPVLAWSAALAEGEGGWIGRPGTDGAIGVVQIGGALRAYALASGGELWHRPLRSGAALSGTNVVVAGARAFIGGGDSVYAVDAASGRRLWAFQPDASAGLCEIRADADAVYLGTYSHQIYALDAGTGAVRWKHQVGPDWSYTGVVTGIGGSGDTLYIGLVQTLDANDYRRTGHIVALERTTGRELWHYTTTGDRSDVTGAPTVAGAFLLAGDVYGGSFFAVDRFTAQERWRVRVAPDRPGPGRAPIERDGIVYAGTPGGVYAVRLATGGVIWQRTDIDLQGVLDLALCNGQLIAQNLALRLLDPRTGRSRGALFADHVDGVPTSGLAVGESRVIVVGESAVYGLDCGG